MNRSWLLASLVLGCARAPTPPPAADPPAAAPVRVVESPAPAPAPAAEPEPDPRALELDDEPELDERRRELRALVASVPYVVRGRVRQAAQKTEWRGGQQVSFSHAVVDVLEWLRGDPKLVFPNYRRSFPLFTSVLPVNVSKMPSASYRHAAEELLGRVGEERLFFVHLPSENSSGYSNDPPPQLVLARYGKYSVSAVEHLPAASRADVLQALEDLAAQRTWIEANAERLRVVDRFAPASDTHPLQAVAESVRDFVAGELAAAGVRAGFDPPERKDFPDLVTFSFPLAGRTDEALAVSLSLPEGKVRAFRLRGPRVLELSKHHAALGDDELLRRAERALGLRFAGGKVFRDVSRSFRGDGASLFQLTLHAGTLGGRHAGRSGRSVDVTITGEPPVIVEYTNEWARSLKAP